MSKGAVLVFVLGLLGLAGCAGPRAKNAPAHSRGSTTDASDMGAARADLTYWSSAAADKPFIGIAISGGGSRAANFAWAVLEQLQASGLLDDVDSISSVSGGSLAAGLYALRGPTLTDADAWRAQRKLLEHDFLGDWLQRLLNPGMLLRSTFMGTTRTQLMAEVFDDVLFGKSNFADLGPPGPGHPQLFLNSTSSVASAVSQSFVFDNAEFQGRLASRLDLLPLSEAVIASGAFPGVFGSIPLRNYRERLIRPDSREAIDASVFEHVYDGGASDNLGVWTLLRRARYLYQTSVGKGRTLRGCLIIAIDAHAADYRRQLKAIDVDTDSSLVDLLVKPSAWASIDALLYSNRVRSLQALGVTAYETRGSRSSDRFVPIHQAERAPGGRVTIGQTWTRFYDAIARFPLFGPYLPWEPAAVWAEPDPSIVDTATMSDAEVARIEEERLQRTEALQRAAPECLFWHITFDRLHSLSDFELSDGAQINFPPVPYSDAFRLDVRRTSSTAGSVTDPKRVGSVTNSELVETISPRISSLGTLGPRQVAELININGFRHALWALTASIGTSYRLVGPADCNAEFIGKGLKLAARVLVTEDARSMTRICDWYRSHGLTPSCGPSGRSSSAKDLPQPWYSSEVRTTGGRELPLFACSQPPTRPQFEEAIRNLERR